MPPGSYTCYFLQLHQVQVTKVPSVKMEDVALPPSVLNAAFMDDIKAFLRPDQVCSLIEPV